MAHEQELQKELHSCWHQFVQELRQCPSELLEAEKIKHAVLQKENFIS